VGVVVPIGDGVVVDGVVLDGEVVPGEGWDEFKAEGLEEVVILEGECGRGVGNGDGALLSKCVCVDVVWSAGEVDSGVLEGVVVDGGCGVFFGGFEEGVGEGIVVIGVAAF